MTYYVKGRALNGECSGTYYANSVQEAINKWKEETYCPEHVIEVREYNINGKKVKRHKE